MKQPKGAHLGNIRRTAGLIAIIFLTLSVQGRRDGEDKVASAEMPDRGDLFTGITGTLSRELEASGWGQSFKIPTLEESPTCDEIQKVRLDAISVGITAEYDSECMRRSNDIEISIRTSREGSDIASARASYKYPITSTQMVSAQFSEDVLLNTDEEYYFVVSRGEGNNDTRELYHWIAHDLQEDGYSFNDVHQFENIELVGEDSEGNKCEIDEEDPPFAVVYAAFDESNQYTDGDSDMGSIDLVASIHYSFVSQSRVLALVYNPTIGEVDYEDDIGAMDPEDYEGKSLSDIMSYRDWANPTTQIEELAARIEEASGHSVSIDTEIVTLDEWPIHKETDLTWFDDVGRIKSIEDFVEWDDHTWPCYPHIPEVYETLSGDRYRRNCYPVIETEFDYESMLSIVVGDDETVLDKLNGNEFDEIWIVADPSSTIRQSVLLVSPEDEGYLLDTFPLPIESLEKRVPVLGFSMDLSLAEMLRLYAVRVERTMAAVYDGNLYPSCEVNSLDGSIYNQFTRVYSCRSTDGTATPMPGSVGHVMIPVNADALDSSLTFHNGYSDGYVPSDVDRWREFPDTNEGELSKEVNCQQWGCTDVGYYFWWLSKIPRNKGETGDIYHNLWPYIVCPGCFPEVSAARYDPTPALP